MFNHILDKFPGLVIAELEINESATREWHQNFHSPWMFETLGTGVVYVDAVRFEDAEIWHADREQVLAEFQKIEKEITKYLLGDGEIPF